jgi:hypothetical protein
VKNNTVHSITPRIELSISIITEPNETKIASMEKIVESVHRATAVALRDKPVLISL